MDVIWSSVILVMLAIFMVGSVMVLLIWSAVTFVNFWFGDIISRLNNICAQQKDHSE